MSGPESANDPRRRTIPYARPTLDDRDIDAVVEVLRGPWLTTGPKVAEFEAAFARYTQAPEAVALSSGTAALHAALHVLDLRPGDEVIVPAMTFVATANAVVYCGATPVFADVEPDTLLLSPADVARRVTDRTRAIVAVDYAGQPCDYVALREIAARYGLVLVADACHALGGALAGRPVGTLADLSAFSLHAVKPLVAGEGGVVTTNRADWAARLRRFRNHGIAVDHHQRSVAGDWRYEQVELGFNYRLTDVQCALASSQLATVDERREERAAIAESYARSFADCPAVRPLAVHPHVHHAWHLYVVRLPAAAWKVDRDTVYRALRGAAIGVQVHYPPAHLHPYYRQRFGMLPGQCPVAEAAATDVLSLPCFARMLDDDRRAVIGAVEQVVTEFAWRSR